MFSWAATSFPTLTTKKVAPYRNPSCNGKKVAVRYLLWCAIVSAKGSGFTKVEDYHTFTEDGAETDSERLVPHGVSGLARKRKYVS